MMMLAKWKWGDKVSVRTDDNYQTHFYRKGILQGVFIEVTFGTDQKEMIPIEDIRKGWKKAEGKEGDGRGD